MHSSGHKSVRRAFQAGAVLCAAAPACVLAQQGTDEYRAYGQYGIEAPQQDVNAQPGQLDRSNAYDRLPARQQPVQLKPFTYSLTLSPRITYSDNAALAPEGQEHADGLASVFMRGGALINRVRFKGMVAGNLQVGSYFDPQETDGVRQYDQTVVSQNITAAGTARLVDNLLYVDVAAAGREQVLDEGGRVSGSPLVGNDQRADSYSLSLSPYLFTRMSNESTLEARYRFIATSIYDEGVVDGVENYLNDSQAHELIAEYSSGRLFDRLGFSAKAFANSTRETGSDVLPEVDFTQTSVSGEGRYALNRKVSLTGTLGYDDIQTDEDSPFDEDDLSGVFWNAGVALQPGRRTEAELALGERYGGTWVDASASYRYSSRLQFRLAANRRFQTTSQSQSANFGVLQSETLTYADELRQLQNLTSADILDRVLEFNEGLSDLNRQQAGLARADAIYGDIIAQSQRTSLILRAGFDRSDFGFQVIDTYTLAGSADHRFSRRLGGYTKANYQQSSTQFGSNLQDCLTALQQDPDTIGLTPAEQQALCLETGTNGGDAQTLTLVAGLDYLLFRDINSFAELSRSQRFSDSEEDEYTENAVTVGISYEF